MVWTRDAHNKCDATDRDEPDRCAECFEKNFGSLLAVRRCWYCSTDAFWWQPWQTINGHLACRQCSEALTDGGLPYVRLYCLYRAHGGMRMGAGDRQREVYYQIKDFKEQRGELAHLEVPLGNVLRKTILSLDDDEDLDVGAILVPVPSSDPARDHAYVIARQAASGIGWLSFEPGLLVKEKIITQKGAGLSGRRAQNEDAYRATRELDGEDVIIADDLLVTGSTFSDCARALTDAGAGRVYGVAIARKISTPRDVEVYKGSGSTSWPEPQCLDDQGGVFFSSRAKHVCLHFGCHDCEVMLKTGFVDIPKQGFKATHTITCDCGAAHSLVMMREGQELHVRLEGRRRSEMVCYFGLTPVPEKK